ncbi:iron(III) transport system permease protein [Haloferula luteola]|uniref:Iron(III) transport system permease protein n=1 Tax=Haloferula luteola TaxID=595692 RepID=A0A840UUQ0_9BACT|nr:iron ABC transporter permease [Haloferula luteola]MBB5349927.1 iron(III) transport system permease protein [Haloferula luteola]
MMKRSHALAVLMGVSLIFLVFFIYPSVSVLSEAFRDPGGGFTTRFVTEVFRDPVYVEGLWNALLLGVVSTLASFVIAFPLSLLSHRYDFFGKKALSVLILIPLVLPPFVGAVGMTRVLSVTGSLNALLIDWGLMDPNHRFDWLAEGRFWGIVVMNALHLYPILYMNISAALANLDPAMEQAAQNLGCPPWRRLMRITLPLAMPGIFAGGSIVFIWAFTELGVPLVFNYTRVAPVQVFQGIKDLSGNPAPYALVAVMLLVSATAFGLTKWFFGGSTSGSQPRPKGRGNEVKLRPLASLAVALLFFGVFFLASVPHAGVVALALSEDWYDSVAPLAWTLEHFKEALGDPLVVPSIENSLVYASVATLVAAVLGLAIAWVVVRSNLRGRLILDALVMLPLAVPGLVLAFGYLALSQEGKPLHFLVKLADGPALLLIAAYAIRRLPYVVRAAVAGLQQSNPAMEEAARSLGANPWRTLRRISIPLIGANVAAGAILAFAFAMLEVSDSLILAEQVKHYPITKAIYTLLSNLGNGQELAAALGTWSMVFLAVAIIGATRLAGKKGGLFKM